MKLTYHKTFSEMVASSNSRRSALAMETLRDMADKKREAMEETERINKGYMYKPNHKDEEVPIHRHK